MIVRSNLTSSSCLRHVPPSVFILLRHDPDCDGCPCRDQGGRPVGDALEALGRQHPAAAQGRSRGGGQAEAAKAPTDGFAASNLMEALFFSFQRMKKNKKNLAQELTPCDPAATAAVPFCTLHSAAGPSSPSLPVSRCQTHSSTRLKKVQLEFCVNCTERTQRIKNLSAAQSARASSPSC